MEAFIILKYPVTILVTAFINDVTQFWTKIEPLPLCHWIFIHAITNPPPPNCVMSFMNAPLPHPTILLMIFSFSIFDNNQSISLWCDKIVQWKCYLNCGMRPLCDYPKTFSSKKILHKDTLVCHPPPTPADLGLNPGEGSIYQIITFFKVIHPSLTLIKFLVVFSLLPA